MRILLPIIFFIFPFISFAQEINSTVMLNKDRVQTQETQVLDDLQKNIEKFINQQKWTKDSFKEVERIKLNIQLTLKAETNPQSNYFAADVQVQSSRPIFGSDYESVVLAFLDSKWNFSYNESDRLIYNANIYQSELVGLISYYVYMALGMDYDTFKRNGGTDYYLQAQKIMNQAQNSGGAGWSAFGDKRDRYFLVENILDPQFSSFRIALYEYYRLGMDKFSEDPKEARAKILGALQKIENAKKNKSISILIDLFFEAKQNELVQIFSQGDPEIAKDAAELLMQLNPANANKYRKLIQL
ncbi:type IX secretion system protein PorD [Sediminitomix flava]|uniref:Uncharacterized protein DUF4835 n=1 Tax=Sediminitomix flava TaxID=379075 RepID=A0A315ZB88_SEDFL|nr:DUF4835 family protein [Sediminitomix flava]PWJ42811.1 uncharacterized protein DUF4835 [Sediminitomix flava]